MTAGDTLLRADGLHVRLGGKAILDAVGFSAEAGELVAVVGPNGAGKTTLLKALCGLVAAKGTVEASGKPLGKLSLAERARRIAYLPQGHVFHWPLAAGDIVALGRLPRTGGADLSDADRQAVRRAMAATGVTEFAGRAVTTLSGGERARVALSRVLATEAKVILADEPTASLDPRYQLIVLDILRQQAKQGGAVVIVLHDLNLAARHADRIVALKDGRVAASGTPREVLTKPLLADIFGVNAQIVTLADAPVVIPWSVA